jgi:hypothetical protein
MSRHDKLDVMFHVASQPSISYSTRYRTIEYRACILVSLVACVAWCSRFFSHEKAASRRLSKLVLNLIGTAKKATMVVSYHEHEMK